MVIINSHILWSDINNSYSDLTIMLHVPSDFFLVDQFCLTTFCSDESFASVTENGFPGQFNHFDLNDDRILVFGVPVMVGRSQLGWVVADSLEGRW